MVYCNGLLYEVTEPTVTRLALHAPNPADALPYDAPMDLCDVESADHDPSFYESSPILIDMG